MRRVWRTLPQKRAARPVIFGQRQQQFNNRIGLKIKDRLPRNRCRSPTGRRFPASGAAGFARLYILFVVRPRWPGQRPIDGNASRPSQYFQIFRCSAVRRHESDHGWDIL